MRKIRIRRCKPSDCSLSRFFFVDLPIRRPSADLIVGAIAFYTESTANECHRTIREFTESQVYNVAAVFLQTNSTE